MNIDDRPTTDSHVKENFKWP